MPIALDLFGEVETADGRRFKWDANQGPGSRPLNFSFGTKIGEGFSNGSVQLSRRIDQDYADLDLVNSVVFTGADGSVAYEGRIAAMPRELSDRHSIGVTLAGWMAHTKQKRFVMPFVDRSLTSWGDMPRERKAAVLASSISIGDFSYASDQGGLTVALPNQALGGQTNAEVWYQAPPGATVAAVGYRGKTTSLPGGWIQTFVSTTSRDAASQTTVSTTLDDTLRSTTLASPAEYLMHVTYSNGSAATPAAGAGIQLSKIAVYGNSGLTIHTGDASEPGGVYASDVIRWLIANYCPKLNAGGVVDTDYVIQHLAFNAPTFAYDALLEVNKYHLWHLGAWDNRAVHFRPYDLSDYDWEIRTDDPGTTFSPQGPSTEDLFNGIAVTYTDPLTGVADRLTPDDHSELRDSSPSNPWNSHGEDAWDEIVLSTPTLAQSALNLGTAALADRNRPRTPGTITVRGYIRDRSGNLQPAWKVRAGDTIAITNFPNDTPRLIVETDYNDEDKTLRLSIDKPFALLDAYLDRLSNAVSASGVSA